MGESKMLRRIIMVLAGVLALAGSPLRAQDAEGYWAGTLAVTPSASLRIGAAIARDDAGALAGTLDSADQHAFDIPLADVTSANGTLAFSVPAVGARYEARWNAAHAAWEGTFFQSGQAWPLSMAAGARPERTTAPPLPAEWMIPPDGSTGAVLERRIAGRDGAALVVGVIEAGETRVVSRGPVSGPAADGDTLFEIGSMTKVFTALLLADMVRSGEVSLDDPVEQYLPAGALMPRRGEHQITLRHLTMQNSGLPRLPDNMPYAAPTDPYADYTEAQLLAFLARYELPRDPGAEYEYSNLGVGLLGYALARAGGRDYDSLLRARILDPLGLHDTGIALSADQQPRFAAGHDEYMRPTPPWHLPALAGAGALRSTANDMLRFLAAALDPASPIGPSMELLLSDRLGTAGAPRTALGWMTLPPPTGEVLHHGGGTGGFRTHMALQPATGRAVVVLANAAVEPSTQDIAFHLIAGLPLAAESPVPPAPPPIPTRIEVVLDAARLDSVTGIYSLAPGITLAVRREGDGLLAQITGQPALPIYPSARLEFFWRVVDARLRFTEEAGQVSGGVLLQNGREIPLTRIEQ